MWKHTSWNKYLKIGITTLLALTTLFVLINPSSSSPYVNVENVNDSTLEVSGDVVLIKGRVSRDTDELNVDDKKVVFDNRGNFNLEYKVKKDGQVVKIVAIRNGKTTEETFTLKKITKQENSINDDASKNSGKPAKSFSDGTYEVGKDIEAGRYKTEGTNSCYYERLSGLSGKFEDIISNDNSSGQAIIVIQPSDVAFKTERCGTWKKQS